MTWWKVTAGVLVAYWALAEIAASMRMKRRERERERVWNRPPAPLPVEAFIARVYLAAGMFVLGAFVSAMLFKGC